MPTKKEKLSRDRFLNIVKELEINGLIEGDADFARKIGVIPQAIYDIRSGKNQVGLKFITLIENKFPQVNISYLKEEQDNPILKIKKNTTEDPQAHHEVSNVEMIDDKSRKIRVPIIPLNATASFVESIDGGYRISELDFEYEVVEKLAGVKYSNLTVIFKVHGDSMWPIYRNESKLLCTWVDKSNWQLIRGPHVISTKTGMLLLKRIVNRRNGTFELKSDNTNYGDIELTIEQIQAIWKVEFITYAPAE